MSNISDIEAELEAVIDQIENAKATASQAEGAISAHMKQLKSDHSIKDLKGAKLFIENGKSELNKLEEQIAKLFSILKKDCGYDFE